MHKLTYDSILPELRSVCDELAARQGLSGDVLEEIRTHLEDKLLGYLNGQIAISGEDALLLVRAHFGDTRGVACQIRDAQSAPPALRRRRRMLVKSAGWTASLTLLGLPLTWFISGQAIGNAKELLTMAIVILAILTVSEAGVLLAAMTDLRSRWQRAVAAFFLLPAAALMCTALAVTARTLCSRRPPGLWGDALLVATEFSCLLGHLLLIALLTAPNTSAAPSPLSNGILE